MLSMAKPRYFMPVHGEAQHLRAHAQLAVDLGMDEKNIFILDNGDSLEMANHKVRQGHAVESGVVYVDGGTVTEADPVVIRDRQKLAQEGVVTCTIALTGKKGTVKAIEVNARGVSFSSDPTVVEEAQQIIRQQVEKVTNSDGVNIDAVRRNVRNQISNLLWTKTHSRPMVIPVVLEV